MLLGQHLLTQRLGLLAHRLSKTWRCVPTWSSPPSPILCVRRERHQDNLSLKVLFTCSSVDLFLPAMSVPSPLYASVYVWVLPVKTAATAATTKQTSPWPAWWRRRGSRMHQLLPPHPLRHRQILSRLPSPGVFACLRHFHSGGPHRVRPGKVSRQITPAELPPGVELPDYARTGQATISLPPQSLWYLLKVKMDHRYLNYQLSGLHRPLSTPRTLHAYAGHVRWLGKS